MVNSTSLDIALEQLGVVSTASGTFQPSVYGATPAQTEAGAQILGSDSAYSSVNASAPQGVCCMDDRLEGWLRLAGGALVLALMKNMARGGNRLSDDLLWLKDRGFYLFLHEDCGALAKVMAILNLLTNVNAAGYRLLEADGVLASLEDRQAIAAWAASITADYADVDAAKEVVHGVQPVVGPHVAGYATLIDRQGVAFDAAKKIEDVSGLKTLVVTLWAADDAAARITDDATLKRRIALLGKVFSAETVLVLGGPELVVSLIKR